MYVKAAEYDNRFPAEYGAGHFSVYIRLDTSGSDDICQDCAPLGVVCAGCAGISVR